MSDKLKEFVREAIAEIMANSSMEERLKGVPAEERLKGLSPEEVVKALSPEILEAVRKLTLNVPPSKPK